MPTFVASFVPRLYIKNEAQDKGKNPVDKVFTVYSSSVHHRQGNHSQQFGWVRGNQGQVSRTGER